MAISYVYGFEQAAILTKKSTRRNQKIARVLQIPGLFFAQSF